MTSTEMTCDYCKAGAERMTLVGPSIHPWVGGEVKRRRREAGLTQTQLGVTLASSTSGAWSTAKVSRIETGARKVTLDELWILSLIFGCSVADFMPDRALAFSGLHPEAFKQSSYQPRGCSVHAGSATSPGDDFIPWLLRQADRDDPVGDLARDVQNDRQPCGSAEELRVRLDWQPAIESLDRAEAEWRNLTSS